MIKIDILRGRIFSKYKSVSECAKAADLSRHVIYNILNKKKLPNSDEIKKIGKACDFTAEDIKSIF